MGGDAVTMLSGARSVLDSVQTVMNTVNRDNGNQEGRKLAEERAALYELDAREQAGAARDEAEKRAHRLREERERRRSAAHAHWGGSGTGMSGSALLLNQSGGLRDRQDEDDLLAEAERDSAAMLTRGQAKADAVRIRAGATPRSSLLVTGPKLYGPRS